MTRNALSYKKKKSVDRDSSRERGGVKFHIPLLILFLSVLLGFLFPEPRLGPAAHLDHQAAAAGEGEEDPECQTRRVKKTQTGRRRWRLRL